MKKIILAFLLTMLSLNAKSIAYCKGEFTGESLKCMINENQKVKTSLAQMYKKGWSLITVVYGMVDHGYYDYHFYLEK